MVLSLLWLYHLYGYIFFMVASLMRFICVMKDGHTHVCASAPLDVLSAHVLPHGCLCMVPCGSMWFCVAVCGFVWFCVAVCGSVWFGIGASC